jgi:hypothetical protein
LVQVEDGQYFQDALNISPYEFDEPDLTMDLCKPQTWPWTGIDRWGQSLSLNTQQLEKILIRQMPASDLAWQALCENTMQLLADNGHLIFELPISELDISEKNGPHFKSGKKIIDSFTDRFWRGIGLTHRLAYVQMVYADEHGQPCSKELARTGRIVLIKRVTTAKERTMARVHAPNFARII